jgi:hypothetical protein
MFIAPSLTTFQDYNPSMRIYSYDTNTKKLQNYLQYYTNLTNDNLSGNVTFSLSYDFKKTYGQPDLSPGNILFFNQASIHIINSNIFPLITTESFANILKNLFVNETTWNTYQYLYNNKAMKTNCDNKCKYTSLCAMSGINLGWYAQCITQHLD